jgi:MacB-like periplasmic core domain/FtsX-like permease family
MTIVGRAYAPGEPPVLNNEYGVSGEYFKAMGIRLIGGRFLETADSHREPRACVVDENFARHYWPNGEAVGQRLWEGPPMGRALSDAFTIVGVVGSVKQTDLADLHAKGAVYFPYKYMSANDVYFVARTVLPPESFGAAMQQIVRGIDPDLPVSDLKTMESRIDDSLLARRTPALLTGFFATIALLLAAIGTYGVLSYAVAQRRREIGIRMVLGAQPAQIRGQFLSIGLRLLAVGSGLGVLGSWVVGKAMQDILFGVPPLELATVAATAIVMGAVSITACMIPSGRAARLTPVDALAED